ncbi:ketopantoate reductase family protein [Marimonas lutisalis]|uniref:ketopantoate reductase family protein n=1 Tax=Marimonas lutisalis TaxID=2545756 RepID=UPI0010FA443F|nr:ketopantoate reductase family protein [Marimonas lutisalis]
MKIAIMGSGGIGGYFGAQLAQKTDSDVWFVARGDHLRAIRENGLQIKSDVGGTVVFPAQATDDPKEIGPVDIVVLAVKLYSVNEAVEQCRPLVSEETGVISFQNGIGTEERIDEILGLGHAIGGIAYAPLAIEAPGIIRHTGNLARLTVGEMSGARSERLEAFVSACRKAEIETAMSESITRELWEKFVFLASFSGITCLTRQPIGFTQQEQSAKELFEQALKEAVVVADAEAVKLDDGFVGKTMAFAMSMGASAQSSMLTDLQNGRPLENAWLSGKIVELARKHKICTPAHKAFYAAMKPFETGTD